MIDRCKKPCRIDGLSCTSRYTIERIKANPPHLHDSIIPSSAIIKQQTRSPTDSETQDDNCERGLQEQGSESEPKPSLHQAKLQAAPAQEARASATHDETRQGVVKRHRVISRKVLALAEDARQPVRIENGHSKRRSIIPAIVIISGLPVERFSSSRAYKLFF